MFYTYIKGELADIQAAGLFHEVVARPVGNQDLVESAFERKTLVSSNTIYIEGKKAYEKTSETAITKILDLSGEDYIEGVSKDGDNNVLVYFEMETQDTNCIVRLTGEVLFPSIYSGFTTMTYPEALAEAKTLEDNADYVIQRSYDEVEVEKALRMNTQLIAVNKQTAVVSAFRDIITSDNSYSLSDSQVDVFLNDESLDAESSDPYIRSSAQGNTYIEPTELGEYPLYPLSGENAYVLQTVALPISPSKIYVVGIAVSAGHLVEVSNDNGVTWDETVFTPGSFVSGELTLTGSKTGTTLIRITLFQGSFEYRPRLFSWGLLWK